MNSFESFLLNSGLSWTSSKVIPYLLMILIGIILVVLLKRILKLKNKPVKIIIQLLFFILPFIIYFISTPIYEGDFSNNSIEINRSDENKELQGKKLVVLSIPGCQYCFAAIGRMKKLKERVPSLEIEYLLCSNDSINNPSYLKWYSDEANNAFDISVAENVEAMSKLAEGVFPTFVLVNNNEPLKKWSNDSFGVVALDELEISIE
ncbi:MAG: hypothetical protein COA33_009955 [Fluviicola sp.]|nr:hypothetical protein [Fluviicola sp.]